LYAFASKNGDSANPPELLVVRYFAAALELDIHRQIG
jgi:hypothetical protein